MITYRKYMSKKTIKRKDKIKGGLADKKKISDFNRSSLKQGAKVEMEHTKNKNIAKEIASKPPIAVRLAKESVLKSFDTTIESGLEFERKNFYLLFASEDQKEGMKIKN